MLKCKAGSQVALGGSGTLTVTSLGKHGISSGSATDEQDASLTVRALTLQITTELGNALHAEQTLTIESGNLTLTATDDALHSDGALTIGAADTDGPAICITGCDEGVEAAQIVICSGDLEITATNDCINAANSQLQDAAFEITISGGNITAFSTSGDGLDANGTMTITGGEITVWTANTADNQPLDADGAITITGGTVLAAGGSGSMRMQLTTEQPYLLQQSGAAIVAGETLSIADADGTNILDACQAPCTISFLFYTSPDLTDGQSYTLQGSGSASVQLEAQTGTLQGGMMPGGPAGGPGADVGRLDAQPPAGKAARLPHLRMVHHPAVCLMPPPASQVLKLPSKSAVLCRPWPAAQCFFRFPAMDSCIYQMDMLHCILHYFRGEKKWKNNRKREVHFPASSVLYWRQRAHRSGWAIYGDSRISRQSMAAGSFCSFILSWR